jgi:pyruvate formate lyase activating enzyme
MKGLFFDIKRYAVHDGPGIRTTVFFKGCPLSCWWCHNPEGIRKEPEEVVTIHKMGGKDFPIKETVGRWMTVTGVMREINKERTFMEESGGGVTFSGGEPLWQSVLLEDLLLECKREGYHTAVDTTGHTSRKSLRRIMETTDLFLYDLKHMDEAMHMKYTGVSNRLILENLSFLAEEGKDLFIRIPVIPEVNNDEENIAKMLRFLQQLNGAVREVDLLPYHALAAHKYEKFGMEYRMAGVPEPTEQMMQQLKEEFEKAGFQVKIGG